MTNLSAPAATTEQAEAILQVFQTSAHPLTVPQAEKLYNGPKLKKNELRQIVESQLLMQGKLFKCSPSGRTPRYWGHDEEQRVRDIIEEMVGREALAESKLTTAVNKALPKISSPAAIKTYIQVMRREGLLHERPGKGKGKAMLLSLQPYNPLDAISFKAATLKDLSAVLAKVESLGGGMDQFLQVLRQRLRASAPESSAPLKEPAVQPEMQEERNGQGGAEPPAQREIEDLILKGMRDLDSAAEQGASVLLRDLRRHMPAEYRRHETFDAAVIDLAEQGKVVLHRHDQPSCLTDAERDELVRDEAGTSYTSIAKRV